MKAALRSLPSVDVCLQAIQEHVLKFNLPIYPRPLLRQAVHVFLEQKRNEALQGTLSGTLAKDILLQQLLEYAQKACKPRLRRVLNATGVVLHTNLGRSVLAKEAVDAAMLAASGYSNLELDLATGERGSRQSLVEDYICQLTGAEAALVVNNNAAAVLLMLNTLCRGGEVVVSRGQLVEIGGSFRIPEVMAWSGCFLKEVGTTNCTHLKDYQMALTENTKALLRVHSSNYRIIGYHAEVSVEDLASFAHGQGLPLLEDLGSGCLVDYSAFGLPSEPTVRSVLKAGADVVTFSGDKALGGPQAGILAGKKEFIAPMASNPLMRALRCDKMTLAALEATFRLYMEAEGTNSPPRIPTVQKVAQDAKKLASQATSLLRKLRKALQQFPQPLAKIKSCPGTSLVGGGSFPESPLPTTLVRVIPFSTSVGKMHSALLASTPPLLARIEDNALVLDTRTLAPEEFNLVAQIVAQALITATQYPKDTQ